MRIQDPAGLIPEDEPVFLIRGKDIVAPSIVEFWAERAEAVGADPVIVKAARNQAVAMYLYQSNSGNQHIPDMDKADMNDQDFAAKISGVTSTELWFTGTVIGKQWMAEGCFLTEAEAVQAAELDQFVVLVELGLFPKEVESAKKLYWPHHETWETSKLYKQRQTTLTD